MDVDEKSNVRGGQAAGGRLLTARGLRTRAVLIEAAKEVFEATSFAEARITDITARARVSTGTFYTYFDSKEEIFREVAAQVLSEMSQAPRRDPDNHEGDPIRDIAHASRQYFLACVRNAAIARSIEQLTLSDSGVARARHGTLVTGVKRVQRWIVDLQDRGICDRTIDAWTTAMVLHTMNVRAAYDRLVLSSDIADLDLLVDTVAHIWARTVGLETVEP